MEAGWDDEILREQLEALVSDGFDLDLTGFTHDELASYLDEDSSADQDDEAPEVETTAVTQPGDIWLLGPHRILCGDALESSHLDVLMGGEPADMVFTDPPYGVAYRPAAKPGGAAPSPIANDDLDEGFGPFLHQTCLNLYALREGESTSDVILTTPCVVRCFHHSWRPLVNLRDLVERYVTLGRSDYQRQYEPLLYGWKQGGARHWCGDRNQGDVWCFDKPRVNALHPTMKPVELIERTILSSSRSGDRILDVFGGSGSTSLPARKRNGAVGSWNYALYVDVTIRRWRLHRRHCETRLR